MCDASVVQLGIDRDSRPKFPSQSILYGAQSFSLAHLFTVIARCKERDVQVALSIDGTQRSGSLVCNVPIPSGLSEREVFVHCGRSMLKRFQMNGKTLENEVVTDRLLLTYYSHHAPKERIRLEQHTFSALPQKGEAML